MLLSQTSPGLAVGIGHEVNNVGEHTFTITWFTSDDDSGVVAVLERVLAISGQKQ